MLGIDEKEVSPDLIMPLLPKAAENPIAEEFVVMCAEKIRRLLRLFLSRSLPGHAVGSGCAASV